MWEFLIELSKLFAAFGLSGLVILMLFLGIFGMGFYILNKQLTEAQAQTTELKNMNLGNALLQEKIKENGTKLEEIKVKQDLHGICLVKMDLRTEKCNRGV